MATPNMATITASLERSLQNCSLNHHQHSSSSSSSSSAGGGGVARRSDSPPADSHTPTLELNSQASLPFHWEQCLDLKTGEIYFINWRTGMKAMEDPRAAEYGGDYSEVEEEEDSSSYDSEGSSSESSPCSSREQWSGKNNEENCYYEERNENNHNSISNNINSSSSSSSNSNSNVLVVAGCKSCLMYYMVPKQLEICPKCCGQLLHFDRSENASS